MKQFKNQWEKNYYHKRQIENQVKKMPPEVFLCDCFGPEKSEANQYYTV